MIQIRLILPNQREFQKDVYRPGVISLSRILWGSLGAGLLLFLIGVFSQTFQIGLLYPPLAASCFISSTCVYFRVARPKPVIVGHFVSAIGGLIGVFIGNSLFAGTGLLIPVKLGLAVLIAAVLMQIFDADHPPAAATAAIPAILPLPAPALVLPLHMAWGAVLAVMFGIAWNRIRFECPTPDPEVCSRRWLNLHLQKPDIIGTGVCILGFLLMCFKPWFEGVYLAGLLVMLAGVVVLSFHHLFDAVIISQAKSQPAVPQLEVE